MAVAATASFHRPRHPRLFWRLGLRAVTLLVVLSAASTLLGCGLDWNGARETFPRQMMTGRGRRADPPSAPLNDLTGNASRQRRTVDPASKDADEIANFSDQGESATAGPCGAATLWQAAKFEQNMISSQPVNYVVTGLVEAIKRDRLRFFGIPFTRARKERKRTHQETKCTTEKAMQEVRDVVERSSIIGEKWKKPMEEVIQSSLKYRASSVLSPNQRARCAGRFLTSLFKGLSRQCRKKTGFWEMLLNRVPMCRGDRWRICVEYQHQVGSPSRRASAEV